jgi:hypothetical protein
MGERITKNNKTEMKSKKKLISGALLAVSAVAVCGLSIAYFSDVINVQGDAKIGTLDLVWCENSAGNFAGELTHYYADGTVAPGDLALNNVNPGDYIKLDACVTNGGNKSAWVKPTISADFGTGLTLNELFQYVEAKTPDMSSRLPFGQFMSQIAHASGNATLTQNVDNLVTLSNPNVNVGVQRFAIMGLKSALEVAGLGTLTYTSPSPVLSGPTVINSITISAPSDYILNGTGLFAETESGAIADGKINLSGYEIGLSANAGNGFQGKTISAGVEIKALQYRNNPNPLWPDAVDYNAE